MNLKKGASPLVQSDRSPRYRSSTTLLLAIVISAGAYVPAKTALGQWPQWGGPNRDFTVETSGLADKWPDDGPPTLWRRELGDGYSAILCDKGLLFTMYRKVYTEEQERVVALDAATGKTVWEHKYPSLLKKPVSEWGHGPNSTPLISGPRLFTVGTNALVHCLDTKTGKVLWARDLVKEGLAAPVSGWGYIRSPIAFEKTIMVAVGDGNPEDSADEDGPGFAPPRKQSLIALDQETGKTIWTALDFDTYASSPRLINFRGQEQLVLYAEPGIIGIDPNNGKLLWQHEMELPSTNVSPVWNSKDLIFWSNQVPGVSALAIRLTKKGGKTVPEELWTSRKMRATMGTPILVGNHVFGSSGKLFVGMNLETGKRTWAAKGYSNASYVYGDGKVIILDEEGLLTLATVTPEAFEARSKYGSPPKKLLGLWRPRGAHRRGAVA